MITVSQIEKRIPIPENGALKKGRKRVYPFSKMKVGDSFQIECTSAKEMDSARRIITSSWGKAIKAKYGKKYTMRKMRDVNGDILIIRVWRIK